MSGNRVVLAALVSGCLFVTACTGGDNQAAPPTTEFTIETPAPTSTPAPTPTGSPTATPPKRIPKTFDPKNFAASPTDVNRWAPMVPGIQAVMQGFVNVGGRTIPHVRVTTITDVTKMVDGVRAVLVLDQDFDGGQLSEQAIDYLAEDVGGNVWYLGSYTEAYEGGNFLNSEDAWLAGVNGAIAGLFMPAEPKTGTPPFYLTQIPGGEQSTAQVTKVGQRTCVPFNCYTDVVVILEGSENKYWAPGVGAILTEPLAGEAQEIEKLINIKELSPQTLAELSAEVLRLDRNASAQAPSVFGGSKAATRSP